MIYATLVPKVYGQIKAAMRRGAHAEACRHLGRVLSLGKAMRKWENHGKTLGKPWENGNTRGKS